MGWAGVGASIAQATTWKTKEPVLSPNSPQQKQLHNQTLKKSQGSNACHFVFLKGPRTSTALKLVLVLVLVVFLEPALDPTCHLVKGSCDLKEAMFGTVIL